MRVRVHVPLLQQLLQQQHLDEGHDEVVEEGVVEEEDVEKGDNSLLDHRNYFYLVARYSGAFH
jgi:hypothetical protein